MSDSKLHLVREDETPDVFLLERRGNPRHRMRGRVTALVMNGQGQTRRHQIVPLELYDISDSGIGATSDQPLDVGSYATIFMPPHGTDAGFELEGTVTRCAIRPDGYSVGIEFMKRTAAA